MSRTNKPICFDAFFLQGNQPFAGWLALMLLAGVCHAQTTSENLPSNSNGGTVVSPTSDWIHFPPRPSLNRSPSTSATNPPASSTTPTAAPEDRSAKRTTAKATSNSEWVQFPPLPPPKPTPSPKATAKAPPAPAPTPAATPSPAETANGTATAKAATDNAASTGEVMQFNFKAFQFEGNTVYSQQTLNNLVTRKVPVVKDLNDIQNAALAVANLYQDDGVLARVDLLPQDLTEGIVTITITEGKFSGARMETANSPKLPADLLVRLVEKAQPVGEAVRLKNMDRATMLLNEVPGVQANVRLSTGEAQGQTDALVQVQDKNNWDGQLTVDNAGTVSVGSTRLSTQFNRYGLLGRGDVGNLQYLHSEGLDYLKLGYSEPLGYAGTRWGLGSEFTHYKVISGYDSLDLRGPSNSINLFVNHPWLRTREMSSDWLIAAEHKNFTNTSTLSSSSYRVENLSNTWTLSGQDKALGTGENNASLQLQHGRVYYDTTPSDGTEGNFRKWRLNLSRKNTLSNTQALQLSYQRQWADRNLDSSEKFGIGGASAVRAYPAAEASGTEASLFSLEWQHDLSWKDQPYKLSAFYDRGEISKYKYSTTTNNSYALEGVGVWIGISVPNRWGTSQWRATWSHRLGTNPAPTSSGADADGTYYLNRFWLSASQVF